MPVLFGYVPLGFAFGMLFGQLGYEWYFATLMSVAVYAGAAQFMAVGLLAAGTGILEIGLATLLLNSRHMFYGLSMAARFPPGGIARGYLIFGLTDETYSLLSSMPASLHPATAFNVSVTALNQLYWVVGCTLGAVLGTELPVNTEGLDFVLIALFVVLAIEQAKTVRQWRPFVLAAVAALAAVLVAGMEHMLVVALGLTTVLLILDWRRSAER